HHGLSEGVRGLLQTVFEVVVMVADETSLIEGARRMHPKLAVVDLSLARSEGSDWIVQLRSDDPQLKIIVISVHGETSICHAVMAKGANGYVWKRDIADELLPSISAVLDGHEYLSAGISARATKRTSDA